MGAPLNSNAGIVAVRVKKKSRSAANIAGHQHPVKAETEYMKWLDYLDQKEQQAAIERVIKHWR